MTVLFLAMALNVTTTRKQQENARAVTNSHTVLNAIDDARNRVRELELLESTYILSGRPEDLERVGPAAAIAQSSARRVDELTRDDPEQQARVPELLDTMQQLEAFYRSAAETRRVLGSAAARDILMSGRGAQLLEQLSLSLGMMEATERQVLYARAESSESAYQAALVTGLTTGIASVLLVVGFVWLLRRHMTRAAKDAAELRALSHELQEADRRKDRFLATLAHELRNPLAPVRTAAGILASPELNAERLAWCQSVIVRQVGQMAALLDDLLDLTRIARGKLKLRREAVSLAAVVDLALEAARPVLDRKEHVLNVQVPEHPPIVDVDAVRLGQALTNLLTNAAKYTDPHGTITFSARVQERDLVLAVQDNGIGIAPEMLSQAFGMFTQVDSDDARGEGGLGIGLALARGVVQLHGGTIAAHSEGIGRGSTFTIELPCVVVHEAAPPPPDDTTGTPERGHRILVADDNRDAGTALGIILEMAGHTVEVVGGVQEALQAIPEFAPHIVFLETDMAEMDGYTLARTLRAMPGGRERALVAIGGWGQAADREWGLAAGFDAHLTKPADPDAVAALVSRPLADITHARLANSDLAHVK
ncbi:MAG: ATP-binding protein [Ramlibacter sp.]